MSYSVSTKKVIGKSTKRTKKHSGHDTKNIKREFLGNLENNADINVEQVDGSKEQEQEFMQQIYLDGGWLLAYAAFLGLSYIFQNLSKDVS